MKSSEKSHNLLSCFCSVVAFSGTVFKFKDSKVVELSCAIGDETVDGRPYSEIVEIARKYIHAVGGFEKVCRVGTCKMKPRQRV